MKKLLFSLALLVMVSSIKSCSSNNEDQGAQVYDIVDETRSVSSRISDTNYQLEEKTTTILSEFSHSLGIFELSIAKSGENLFKISTKKGIGENNSNSIEDIYTLQILNGSLVILAELETNNFGLEKNIERNEVYLVKNGSKTLVTQELIDNINNSVDREEYKRLLSLYIELYDTALSRGTPRTCAHFFDHIGYTATAAGIRANELANDWLAQPGAPGSHKNCTIKGTDTSCLLGNHICMSTVTIQCAC